MYKNQLCTVIPLSQEQEQNAKLQLLLVILLVLLVFSACLLLLLFVCCNHNMRGNYNINSQLYYSTSSINKDKNFMEEKEEPQHQQ
jgi:hypothetical protein